MASNSCWYNGCAKIPISNKPNTKREQGGAWLLVTIMIIKRILSFESSRWLYRRRRRTFALCILDIEQWHQECMLLAFEYLRHTHTRHARKKKRRSVLDIDSVHIRIRDCHLISVHATATTTTDRRKTVLAAGPTVSQTHSAYFSHTNTQHKEHLASPVASNRRRNKYKYYINTENL